MEIFWFLVIVALSFVFLWLPMYCYLQHAEVIRPTIGILLFKKKYFPRNLHLGAMSIMAIGLGNKRIETQAELNRAYRALLGAVEERSYFRHHDRNRLREIYAEAVGIVARRELDREYERWAEKPKAKAKPKVATGWRAVLGVAPDERDTKIIKDSYRRLVMKDHPDRGGNGKKMSLYTNAIDQARKELNFV